MRPLYDIDADIKSCIDPETGEIDDEKLSELSKERNLKIEHVGMWVLEIDAEIRAYEAEKQRVCERVDSYIESIQKTRKSLLNWLLYATDGKKFRTEKVDVTTRPSKKIEIHNEYHIPVKYYKTKIDKRVDRAKLKKDILSGAIDTPDGVEIIDNMNISVK